LLPELRTIVEREILVMEFGYTKTSSASYV
jgi:hypothetical protein